METQDTKAEIPEIKLAKVGDKREKKKGGLAWFEGAGKGTFTGATGGAGAGGGAGSGILSFLDRFGQELRHGASEAAGGLDDRLLGIRRGFYRPRAEGAGREQVRLGQAQDVRLERCP